MRSNITAATGIVLLACASAFPGRAGAQGVVLDPTAHPVITTAGHGEVHIAPDRASLIIAVESRAATASAAAALNATATTSTLAALRAAGLATSQLSTTGFSVSVDYRRAVAPSVVQTATGQTVVQPPITFVATNGVRADIQVLTSLSKVIDAALAGGATQIGQIQFTSINMEQARRAALAQAVEQARSDADAIARASGGSLGSLVEITSAGGGMYGSDMVFSGKSVQIRGVAGGIAAPPTPLAPGDVAVNVNITGRWLFVPGH